MKTNKPVHGKGRQKLTYPYVKSVKGVGLSSKEKAVICNIYNLILEMWPKDRFLIKREIAERTAVTAGVHISTVYKVLKESKNIEELESPKNIVKKQPDTTRVDISSLYTIVPEPPPILNMVKKQAEDGMEIDKNILSLNIKGEGQNSNNLSRNIVNEPPETTGIQISAVYSLNENNNSEDFQSPSNIVQEPPFVSLVKKEAEEIKIVKNKFSLKIEEGALNSSNYSLNIKEEEKGRESK